MDLGQLIQNYWAQITILIGAIGYLVKGVLDQKFKRKEIWYSLYSQKKMDYLLTFFNLYQKIESDLVGIISVYKTVKKVHPLDEDEYEVNIMKLTLLFKELGSTLNNLKFFLPKSNFEVLKTCVTVIGPQIKNLVDLAIKRQEDNLFEEEFIKLYSTTLRIVNDNNVRFSSFKFV